MFSISGKLSIANSLQYSAQASILLFNANQTETYQHTTSAVQTKNYQLSNIGEGDYIVYVIMDGIPKFSKKITVIGDLLLNIELNNTTSISEFISSNNNLEVYPNPFVSYLTLNGNTGTIVRVKVIDIF
jgi:hypothetical protein